MIPDPTHEPWKTVLVEDQALLRNVLSKTIQLDERFHWVGDAEDGANGLSLCETHHPHLLVTDLHLPVMDGLELARQTLLRSPGTRILVLTNLKDPYTLHQLQEIGVHGYVEKDQPLEIFEEAMVEVASGYTYFTALLHRNLAQLEADDRSFVKFLSPKEQRVVALVGDGWTNRQIAERLALSVRSVETYRYRIMKRFHFQNASELADYARNQGLTGERFEL
jgi:DNA-binding NarL/FixJ family response regulator